MPGPRILNVGQCGFDHSSISRTLGRALGAEITPAESLAQAQERLRTGTFDLVLVNRVLNGDGSSGLELIRALKAEPQSAQVPVMLVSNYPEAQQQAVALGALPGFGKASLGAPETLSRLAEVLGEHR